MQKRRASTNSSGEISDEKDAGASVSTIEAPAQSTPSPDLAHRLKTVASFLYEMAKTSSPPLNVQSSISSLSRFTNNIALPSFGGVNGNGEKKEGQPDKRASQEKDDKLPLYLLSMLGVQTNKGKGGEDNIPRWKVKRKVVSQDSIDSRTTHVVSAVARASSKSSLLVRLEDFCQHLFQYPQSKSLAARVWLDIVAKKSWKYSFN